MSTVEWVPYKPLPGKEMEAYLMEAYLDASKQVIILQNKLDKINSFCEDYLKLSNKQKEEYMLDPVLVIEDMCR